MLDQQAGVLADVEGDLVREVIGRLRTGYQVEGREMTPAQLLERLGFGANNFRLGCPAPTSPAASAGGRS